MSQSNKLHEPLNLTFGVEIEHIFGIKQDEVRDKEEYGWLRPENCPSIPNTPALPLPQEDDTLKAQHPHYLLRRENVGLRQAAKIIRQNAELYGHTLEVKCPRACDWKEESEESIAKEFGTDDYSVWRLTLDQASKKPATDHQIQIWSDGKIPSIEGWSYSRLEIISRVLKAPSITSIPVMPNGLTELHSYLSYIPVIQAEKPYFFLTHPEVGSVHVHIGIEPEDHTQHQRNFALNVLQHLGFVCLVFEEVMTLLHHPERHGYRGTKVSGHGRSNRVVPLPDQYPAQHHCDKSAPFSCENAFLEIFNTVDYATLLHVLHLLREVDDFHPREWFVNFENYCEQDDVSAPRTVEFRQHHGTLNADDICQWVIFVTALARFSERMANDTAAEGPPVASTALGIDRIDDDRRSYVATEAKKYHFIFESDEKRSLDGLLDLLQLTEKQRQYWSARANKNRQLWSDQYRCKSTCVHCKCWAIGMERICICHDAPRCDKPPRRDCADWGIDTREDPPADDAGNAGSASSNSCADQDSYNRDEEVEKVLAQLEGFGLSGRH